MSATTTDGRIPATQTPPTPTTRQLALATTTAFLLAAGITVVAILPAEYGVDPLGAGAALGLLRAAPADEAEAVSAGGDLAAEVIGPVSYFSESFASDVVTLELGPYDYVEYKYRLGAGASMQFAWEASAPVMHDFHAEPDEPATADEVSFDKRDRRQAFGVHVAPFAGMHGWFWENPGATPVTVTLRTTGFYTAAMEYRPNRIRRPHQLQRTPTVPPSLAGAGITPPAQETRP